MEPPDTVATVRTYESEATWRWAGFEHRPGDIVISTRSKCGTTWLQMICALLVLGEPDLPAPLAELSPWLDWDIEPIDDVGARLALQGHRRFIKTHTPLDGIPLHPDVTYLVAGRHPLDVADSLFAHLHNIDRDRFEELTGRRGAPPGVPFTQWFQTWMQPAQGPEHDLDTLPGLVHHITNAHLLARDLDVVLVHYDDLTRDLEGEMRRIADHLAIPVTDEAWPALVHAAQFDTMRRAAPDRAPDHLGVLKNPEAFFRSGSSDRCAATLPEIDRQTCRDFVDLLAPDEVARWLWRSLPRRWVDSSPPWDFHN